MPRQLTKLLADLVAIPSVNPMGRNRSGPEYLEENIADYVSNFLKRERIDVEVHPVFPGRPNVVGYVDAGSRETLLLEAHLDTVPVDNMTIDPFEPTVKHGRLFGRGACDTKSSLAAILYTIRLLLRRRALLSRNILIAAVCDEEYGLSGTKALLNQRWKIQYAFVGEPTGLSIINSHKGVMRWRISTFGKSAHSAYPQNGKNAIYHMSDLLQKLKAHANDLCEGKPHPVLGSPTLSVGLIEGGQSVNTVPNRCTIEIDRRTLPGESPQSVLRKAEEAMGNSLRYKISRPHLIVPGLDHRKNQHAVNLLKHALVRSGRKPKVRAAMYVTDASLYARKGIQAVVFGPGRIRQAHAEVEYVRLSEVEAAANVYRALLEGT